ncbi:MAG: hypothetical protein RIN55_01000 [Tissierellaceae bacterium]|nr:hypothetical protein [Tissierellaceae bacterium]
MKHYDYVEWLLYKTKSLSSEQLDEMEEHLYNCDICMDIFLSLIDEEELILASEVVPDDFTSNVMESISKNKVKIIEPKNTKKAFNYQFMYYVAVASVTIFLTFGGFYTNLVDAVPKINKSIETPREMENHIGKFSNRIVNSTSDLLLSIENMSRIKEEKK